MELKNIKLTQLSESKTNPRGADFHKDKAFEELVASITEKGVLQPVLVRLTNRTKNTYEVIAGNRRTRAAKIAGLAEIPAQVVEMSDVEAMEAQIVENLQRADVHPLEEGEAYRKLIEESKYDYASVAAKVGKTEGYVKQRLFLTNLIGPAADAYRAGKIIDGHAVLIAKLATADQTRALKAATDRYNTMTVKELKEWIDETIYNNLDNQPWLKNPEAVKAVGKCQECEPDKASLFGPVKEGACTSLKCWARKMEAFIAWRVKEGKLAKVSSEYGQAPKGVYGRSDYVQVAKAGKDRCKSVHGGIVVSGAEIGKELDICTDQNCKTHRAMKSQYGMTPKEQEQRKAEAKKQRAAEVRKKEKEAKEFEDGMKKVKFPFSGKMLDAMLWLAIEGHGPQLCRPIAQRNKIEPKEFVKTNWEGKKVKEKDYAKSILEHSQSLDEKGKAKLLVEALLQNTYGDKVKKFFERV